jgi:hypothetical protein
MDKFYEQEKALIKDQNNKDSEIADGAALALSVVHGIMNGMRRRFGCEGLDDQLNAFLIASYLHPCYKEMNFAGSAKNNLSAEAKIKARSVLKQMFAECTDPEFKKFGVPNVDSKSKSSQQNQVRNENRCFDLCSLCVCVMNS